MEGSSVKTPETSRPVAPEDAAREPATQEDLRSVRRWTLVAGIWAVAATAVALIALLDTSQGDAEQRATDADRRAAAVDKRVTELERSQKSLTTRVDELESRIGSLAPLSDVTKLQDRVGRAEENASKANDKAGNASDSVKDLEDRVTSLENAPAAGTDDSSGSAGADDNP